MFEFLVMAQREHERLGVTLADSHQKQPAHGEKGVGLGGAAEVMIRGLIGFSVKSTRLLVPAGG